MVRIEAATLEFLAKLSRNNNRAWFTNNRALYEAARANFFEATHHLIGEIAKVDPSIIGVEADECVFRIYRDARFSRDKSPYKTNFGAFIKSGGRRTAGGGYYFHVEPGGSMIAAGIYMPPAAELFAIRTAVARKPEELERIINEPGFRRRWGELAEERLKTAPKGFAKDHPAIELLRCKHYIVVRMMSDKEVLSPRYLGKCMEYFMTAVPLNEYINRAIDRKNEH